MRALEDQYQKVRSKSLAETEEEVEVACLAYVRLPISVRVVVGDRISGRIEVIAEVEAYGPDGRMVAQADAERMGKIIEAAEA